MAEASPAAPGPRTTLRGTARQRDVTREAIPSAHLPGAQRLLPTRSPGQTRRQRRVQRYGLRSLAPQGRPVTRRSSLQGDRQERSDGRGAAGCGPTRRHRARSALADRGDVERTNSEEGELKGHVQRKGKTGRGTQRFGAKAAVNWSPLRYGFTLTSSHQTHSHNDSQADGSRAIARPSLRSGWLPAERAGRGWWKRRRQSPVGITQARRTAPARSGPSWRCRAGRPWRGSPARTGLCRRCARLPGRSPRRRLCSRRSGTRQS